MCVSESTRTRTLVADACLGRARMVTCAQAICSWAAVKPRRPCTRVHTSVQLQTNTWCPSTLGHLRKRPPCKRVRSWGCGKSLLTTVHDSLWGERVFAGCEHACRNEIGVYTIAFPSFATTLTSWVQVSGRRPTEYLRCFSAWALKPRVFGYARRVHTVVVCFTFRGPCRRPQAYQSGRTPRNCIVD